MKSWVWTGLIAATIALPALSCAAWAEGTDDYGCSNATLKGEYAVSVTGYLPSPLVVAVMAVFDGKGNYMQRDYAGDSLRTTGQTDFAPKGQEQGTYKVNPDCTGSMVIYLNAPVSVGSTGVIKGVFVISNAAATSISSFQNSLPRDSPDPYQLKPARKVGRSPRTSIEVFIAS